MRRDATGYIRLNFDPEDRLAVVLIQQEGEDKGKVEQKFYSAVQAAGPRVQAYPLQERVRMGRVRIREPAQAGGAEARQERCPRGPMALPRR